MNAYRWIQEATFGVHEKRHEESWRGPSYWKRDTEMRSDQTTVLQVWEWLGWESVEERSETTGRKNPRQKQNGYTKPREKNPTKTKKKKKNERSCRTTKSSDRCPVMTVISEGKGGEPKKWNGWRSYSGIDDEPITLRNVSAIRHILFFNCPIISKNKASLLIGMHQYQDWSWVLGFD